MMTGPLLRLGLPRSDASSATSPRRNGRRSATPRHGCSSWPRASAPARRWWTSPSACWPQPECRGRRGRPRGAAHPQARDGQRPDRRVAEMAAAMERLELLVRRGERAGVPVRIIANPSGDVAADVMALSDALSPQYVVVWADDEIGRSVVDAAGCPAVVVRRTSTRSPAGSPVEITWSAGPTGKPPSRSAAGWRPALAQPCTCWKALAGDASQGCERPWPSAASGSRTRRRPAPRHGGRTGHTRVTCRSAPSPTLRRWTGPRPTWASGSQRRRRTRRWAPGRC